MYVCIYVNLCVVCNCGCTHACAFVCVYVCMYDNVYTCIRTLHLETKFCIIYIKLLQI